MTELARAVEKGIDNKFIQWADDFGNSIARSVTTSQIRNVYGSVKKMEMAPSLDMGRVLMLKPRLAYAAKRAGSLNELKNELVAAIDKVNEAQDAAQQQERFRRFCQGFEAILAYHRAHGGK